MDPVFSYFLKVTLVLLIILGVMCGRTKYEQNWIVMEYNWFAKVVSIIFSLPAFYVTYSAFSAHFSGKGPPIVVLIIVVIYSVICILWINETYRAKAWFDDEKIYFQSPYGHKMIMNFNEIKSCQLSRLQYYVIISKNGQKIRLNSYMPGVVNFVQFLENHLIKVQ
jgi:hypothetical protein